MLHIKVVINFKYVDETTKCDTSNEMTAVELYFHKETFVFVSSIKWECEQPFLTSALHFFFVN